MGVAGSAFRSICCRHGVVISVETNSAHDQDRVNEEDDDEMMNRITTRNTGVPDRPKSTGHEMSVVANCGLQLIAFTDHMAFLS